MIGGRRIGWVLGSGGARGWAHIGVVRALLAMGVVPDVVVGTSIGALVGAMVAGGVFEAFLQEVERLDFLRLARLFTEVRVPRHGLLSGQPIVAWLDREDLLAGRQIEALPIRFAAVATDLYREQAVVLQTGAASQAVRASISIPGLFDPVVREGRALVDGGLCDPVPVATARALGADFVIAVDVNSCGGVVAEVEEAPTLADTLLQTVRMVENEACRRGLERAPADFLISPKTGYLQTLDFQRARVGVALGEAAVAEARGALVQRLEEGR